MERVAALADLVERRHMRVSALIVGDVRVVFSEPWPHREPIARAQVEQADDAKANVDPKLAELRKRSKAQFGRVLPDESLLALEGVL